MISRFNGEVIGKMRTYNQLVPHRMKSYKDELIENEDGTLRLVRIPLESCEAIVYRKTDQRFNVKCNYAHILDMVERRILREGYYEWWKARYD